jgi:hypothetical protein
MAEEKLEARKEMERAEYSLLVKRQKRDVGREREDTRRG